MTVKYIKSIEPSNKKRYFFNDETIEFELPQNVVDIQSFKIFYDAAAQPAAQYSNGTYLKRFMPRISASIISELIVEINGEVKQHIKDYNRLHNIISDGLNDIDPVEGDRPDTLHYSTINDNNVAISECDFINDDGAYTKSAFRYSYFIVNLLGFFSEGQKFLDLRNNVIKIKIVLAPPFICYEGLKVFAGINPTVYANPRYVLSDIHANIDCYNVDNIPIKKEISFKDYKTYYGTVNDNNKDTNMMIEHTGNINFILGTFIDKDANTQAGLQLQYCNSNITYFGEQLTYSYESSNAQYLGYADVGKLTFGDYTPFNVSVDIIKARTTENLLNNSLYFKRSGGRVKSCKLSHNGMDLTPYLDMYQLYINAKEFFNGGNNRVKSIPSFQNEFFIFPYNFNVRDDNFKSQILWDVISDNNGTSLGGQPIIFLCYDKTVKLK